LIAARCGGTMTVNVGAVLALQRSQVQFKLLRKREA